MKTANRPQIIFFGTSEFAVPVLKLLVEEGWSVKLVITQPDKSVGRNQKLQPPPIKLTAQELGLKIIQPANLDQELGIRNPPAGLSADKAGEAGYELGIVCAYGKRLPKIILDTPKHGHLNLHPSLLPKYRGASPIQAALLNGDKETGVSIMLLDEKMDHGPILAQEKIKINPDETYPQLSEKLAEAGAKLLLKILPDFLDGKLKPRPQDDSKATYTKILKREDGKINWTRSADEIYNQWRALQPWPGIFMEHETWNMKHKTRIKLLKLRPGEKTKQEPGEFVVLDKKRLAMTCAKNQSIEILELQPEGKKPLTAEQFINGYLRN